MRWIISILFFFLSVCSSYATEYYVAAPGSGGNDSNSGLVGFPWATIAKVNSFSFSTGDDVYFNKGDTWTSEQLVIDWTGSSGDHVIIGAYGTGANPIFDGNNDTPGSGCTTSCYNGLIEISAGYSYIDIQDITVLNVEGRGVYANGNSGTQSDYVTVTGLTITNTYRSAIMFEFSDNSTAQDNIISYTSMVWPEYCVDHSCHWPAAIEYQQSTYGTTDGNTIGPTWGEGIGVYNDSDNFTVTDNKVFDNRSSGIYVDGSTTGLIVYNLVTASTWGDGDSDFLYGSYSGISLNVEDIAYNSTCTGYNNIVIRNNLVSGRMSYGVVIALQKSGTTASGLLVYNNTIIDNLLYGVFARANTSGDISSSYFRNNIVWNPSTTGTLISMPSNGTGWTFDHNFWGTTAPAWAQGTGDVTGTPDLSRSTDWYRPSIETMVTVYSFTPIDGGNVIDTGTAIASYNYRIQDGSTSPGGLTIVEVNSGSDWESGAIEFTGSGGTVISNGAPSGTLAAGTTSTNLTCNTNTSATLHYDTSDVAYGSMSGVFDTTGGTSHSEPISGLSNGNTYTYYVRAADSTSSYIITFSVDPGQTNLLNANTYVTGSDTNTYEECHQLSNIWNGSTENGYMNCDATMGCAGCTTANQEYDLGLSYDITDVNVFGDNSNSWTCDTWTFKWKQLSGDSWTTAFTGATCNTEAWDEHAVSIAARYVRFEFVDATSLEVREAVVYGTPSQGGGPPPQSGKVGASYGGSGAVSGQYSANGVGN